MDATDCLSKDENIHPCKSELRFAGTPCDCYKRPLLFVLLSLFFQLQKPKECNRLGTI